VHVLSSQPLQRRNSTVGEYARSYYLLIFLVLVFVPTWSEALDRQTWRSRGFEPVDLHFDSRSGLVSAEMSFPDSSCAAESFMGLVDTGNNLFMVDSNVVTRCGFADVEESTGTESTGKTFSVTFVAVPRLRLGTREIAPQKTVAFELPLFDPPPFSGTIGLGPFDQTRAVIDFANGILVLPPEPWSKVETTGTINELLISEGYNSFLIQRSDELLVGDVVIDDAEPVRAMFDSGAPTTVLSLAYAEDIGLDLLPTDETVTGGAGVSKKAWIVKHINVTFGDFRTHLDNFLAIDHPIDDKPRVTIGLDWMQEAGVIIVPFTNTFYLK
jgi:hypothetical protein